MSMRLDNVLGTLLNITHYNLTVMEMEINPFLVFF